MDFKIIIFQRRPNEKSLRMGILGPEDEISQIDASFGLHSPFRFISLSRGNEFAGGDYDDQLPSIAQIFIRCFFHKSARILVRSPIQLYAFIHKS